MKVGDIVIRIGENYPPVKKGGIWTGYVKNATKDGDYYWVFATVYPTITSEGTKGYLSCRRKASAEEIQAHENLYKQLRMSEKAA